jgi:hypothetical protein
VLVRCVGGCGLAKGGRRGQHNQNAMIMLNDVPRDLEVAGKGQVKKLELMGPLLRLCVRRWYAD